MNSIFNDQNLQIEQPIDNTSSSVFTIGWESQTDKDLNLLIGKAFS